jgi:membrane peptidoglycan carboxypeptidase
MLSASLRAYRDGPDSYDERRWIVTEYLNSVPLAGQVGHGEVLGLGEALWAWYGVEFNEANEILMARPADKAGRVEQARMYLRVLSLLIAQRRPSFYLGTEDGQLALASVTDVYLGLLDRAGVVPSWLAEEARGIGSQFALRRVPSEGMSGPVANKAAGSMRAHLLGLTGTGSVYDLDRMDVVVESTLDMEWHRATTELLENLGDRDFLATNGFLQQGLLSTGDPEQVLYSVLLMERTERGNAIRIQADNYDGDTVPATPS